MRYLEHPGTKLLIERVEAKMRRDYAVADSLRQQIMAMGLDVRDGRDHMDLYSHGPETYHGVRIDGQHICRVQWDDEGQVRVLHPTEIV